MKGILLSAVTMAVMTTSSYAGGDIAPIMLPVEPVAPTHAPTPVYIGVGMVWGQYNKGCSGECQYEDVTYGMMVRLGYDFNQYIGVEARFISTFWGADDLGGQELQHVGLYVKPMAPISENFNIYGLLGYGWTETSTGGNRNLATVDKDGFSAGLGVEFDLSSKEEDREDNAYYENGFDGQGDQELGWGLFVDYQRLLIDNEYPDMDVISAGVTYDF
jgi:OOP family OmpA-OmpF porin